MFAVRSLSGLPPYGPPALSFPNQDAFSEGFVVEFSPDSGDTWVGNFGKFWEGGKSSVHTELGARAVVVIAGGSGYVIDAEEQRLVRELGFDIQHIWFESELRAMVVSNGLWFDAFNADRMLWRSRRLSWDGIRNVMRSGLLATGEAFDPMADRWLPFRLNLSNGEVRGGSYNGPDI
jgi:hypothetical protein